MIKAKQVPWGGFEAGLCLWWCVWLRSRSGHGQWPWVQEWSTGSRLSNSNPVKSVNSSAFLWVSMIVWIHICLSVTHVGNCTWSRLVLPRSTLLWSHRRWRCYTEASGRGLPDHCRNTLLPGRLPHTKASYSSLELPKHNMQRNMQYSGLFPHTTPKNMKTDV